MVIELLRYHNNVMFVNWIIVKCICIACEQRLLNCKSKVFQHSSGHKIKKAFTYILIEIPPLLFHYDPRKMFFTVCQVFILIWLEIWLKHANDSLNSLQSMYGMMTSPNVNFIVAETSLGTVSWRNPWFDTLGLFPIPNSRITSSVRWWDSNW